MAPGAGKTADKVLVRIRKQARHCNFGESLEDNLLDQLIEKLPDIEWIHAFKTRQAAHAAFYAAS